ncbi:MAG TPA: aminotransferase class IV [Ilumatobacteraceae bacterium]|nr:aminotransferase class IV [Ilumatobacteraceae bacterium]
MSDTEATKWAAGTAFVDGEFCPIGEAKISILDMGVTRSDCTYDVVGVWDGRFFRLDAHLDRFLHSVAQLRLDIGVSRDDLEAILHECVSRAGLQRAYVSMTCTRGRPAPGSRDLRTCRNNLYCFAVPYIWVSPEEQQKTGASMWISEIPRIPPESVDPSVKNYHWLDLDMALFDAYDHGAQMVVLRDLSGAITEGPGYNIFAFVDGRWLTPASGTLMGVTRRTLLDLCEESSNPAEEGRLTADELLRADEVLTCTTAGGVMPVTTLNGKPIGDGSVGSRTTDLRDRYWQRHSDPAWSTAVRYSTNQLASS